MIQEGLDECVHWGDCDIQALLMLEGAELEAQRGRTEDSVKMLQVPNTDNPLFLICIKTKAQQVSEKLLYQRFYIWFCIVFSSASLFAFDDVIILIFSVVFIC